LVKVLLVVLYNEEPTSCCVFANDGSQVNVALKGTVKHAGERLGRIRRRPGERFCRLWVLVSVTIGKFLAR
jgi:hypothetical protein